MKISDLLFRDSFFRTPSKLLILLPLFFAPFISASLTTDKDVAPVTSSVNLTWSSSSSCTAYDDWSGSKSSSGTESVVIGKTGWNIYSLNCSGTLKHAYVWGTQFATGLQTSTSSKEMPENILDVMTLRTDNSGVTFSLKDSGGTKDEALFNIDASTGKITFKSLPDFENPLDLNKDNVYTFDAVATDGSNSSTKSLTVKILDSNEIPTDITLSSSSFNESKTVSIVGRVFVTDPDAGDSVSAISLSGPDAELFTMEGPILKTTYWEADYETKNSYSITITVTDSGNSPYTTKSTPYSFSKDFTISVTNVDEPITDLTISPYISIGTFSNHMSINENIAGGSEIATFDTVGGEDTTTYTLSGRDAALFTISGDKLKLASTFSPNYETQNSYRVSITASNSDHSLTKLLDIDINDVDEFPSFSSTQSTVSSINENTTAVMTVNASDVDSLTTSYSIGAGYDGEKFAITSGGGVLTFLRGPDYETPGDTNADNIYDVPVVVSNGKLTSTIIISVTIMDVGEVGGVELPAKVSAVDTQEE